MTKANLYAIKSANMTIALETHENDEKAVEEFEKKVNRTWGEMEIREKTEKGRERNKEIIKTLQICKVAKIDLVSGKVTGMKEVKILRTAANLVEPLPAIIKIPDVL